MPPKGKGTSNQGENPSTEKACQGTSTSSKHSYMYRQMRRTIGVLHGKIDDLEKKLKETNSEKEVIESSRSSELTVPMQCAIVDYKSDRPKFPGKREIHPITFLEDLEMYLKKLPDQGNIIDDIMVCLEGDARNWARIYRNRWYNYSNFREDFLQTYWGETEQSILRRKIICDRWDSNRTRSMLEHFLLYMGQAKMLTNPPQEEQLVNDIIRHFPKEIQYMWILRKGTNTIDAAEFLRRFDTVENQFVGTSMNVPSTSNRTLLNTESKNRIGDSGPLAKIAKRRKEVNFVEVESNDEINRKEEEQNLN